MKNFPGNIPRFYLSAGELHFAETPTIISTVLGSCVAVTMYHPEHHVSAICHALLPEEIVPGDPFRYVDASISAMLRQFERHGMKKKHLEVKLFGGSEIFRPSKPGLRQISVGKQNILRANQILKQEGLNLVASDVGGNKGRKLFFHSRTGEIYLKRLSGLKG